MRHRLGPVVDELEARGVRRRGEGALHRRLVAVRPVEGEVVRRLRMDGRPADGRRHVRPAGPRGRRRSSPPRRGPPRASPPPRPRAPRRRSAPPSSASTGRRGLAPARAVAVLHHRGGDGVLELAGEVPRGEDRHHPRRPRRVAHVDREHAGRAPPGCAGRRRAARPPAPRRRCSVPVRSETGRPPCGARSGWFRTSWLPRSRAASSRFSGAAPDTSGFPFGVQ